MVLQDDSMFQSRRKRFGLTPGQLQAVGAVLCLAAGAFLAFLVIGTPSNSISRGTKPSSFIRLFGNKPITRSVAAAIKQECAGKERRYLVTGAAGFIGFHSAATLATRGDAVVGIDNFNDYYPISLKRARAKVLADKHHVPVVDADINDMDTLNELFQLCPFTHVLHLAAQAGVRYAARKPFTYVDFNLAGSVTILEVVKAQKNMPILVYASSSSVYGLSKRMPFTEDDRADVPASLYAATKRSQEMITHSYFNIYGVSATGLRFFTVYGPWGRPDMSVMAFTRNIMDGKPIRVFRGPNDSELARDFTFCEDIVAGIVGSLDSSKPSGKATAENRVFNLGNTKVVTVTEMVKTLEKLLKKDAIINYVPLPPTGDVLRTNANVTLARDTFGYSPKTNIEQGLSKFVDWYFDYYGVDGAKRPADEKYYVPD